MMKRNIINRLPLRKKISLIIILVVIPLFILMALASVFLNQQLAAVQKRDRQTAVESVINALNLYKQELNIYASMMAQNYVIQRATYYADTGSLLKQMTPVFNEAEVTKIIIYDKEGVILAQAHNPDQFNIPADEFPFVSSALIGAQSTSFLPLQKEIVLQNTVPIYHTDNPEMIVGAVTTAFTVDDSLAEALSRISGVSVLFFSQGAYYASSLGESVSFPLSDTPRQSTCRINGTKYDTQSLLIRTSWDDWFGISIAVDNSNIRGTMLFLNIFLSLLFLIFFSAGLYLALRIANSIVGSTERILAFTQEIARKNYEATLEIHSEDEFQILADTFNEMAASINTSYKELQVLNEDLEKRVDQRTAELRKVNKEQEESLRRLKETQALLVETEKMASLGKMVAGMAHEINTPIGIGVTSITFIEGKTKEILKKYQSGTMQKSDFDKFIDDVQKSSEMTFRNLTRADELIQSFKQMAVDQTRDEVREFDLKEYLEQLILSLQPKIKPTSHSLSLKCDENISLKSDPGALSQIFANLIINSLIHAFEDKEKGKMEISVTPLGETLQLVYRDNGKGMSPSAVQQIFEPFFTTKKGQGGTGLGMSISYNLITQKLKGSIKCESTEGAGTAFTLRIPRNVDAEEGPSA